MESHVCVYQTVRDLCDRQAQVFVACDAVVSRTDEDRALGIDLMKRCGAVPSSSEAVIFDVLEKAGSDHFKALSKLIR
jgi:nicotinamidase-related amidase